MVTTATYRTPGDRIPAFTLLAYPQNNTDEDGDFPQKYLENHFLYFYEPENLYRLAQQLELQSGIDIWEPSEHAASMIRPVFIRLGQLMIEFVDWIDARADEIR